VQNLLLAVAVLVEIAHQLSELVARRPTTICARSCASSAMRGQQAPVTFLQRLLFCVSEVSFHLLHSRQVTGLYHLTTVNIGVTLPAGKILYVLLRLSNYCHYIAIVYNIKQPKDTLKLQVS
jgi:hypothetical protein